MFFFISSNLLQLTFRYIPSGQQNGFVFSADEDRNLLVATNRFGYGNWGRVRAAVHSNDLFRFDYFLRSLSAEELGKRCETLMQQAAKVRDQT